MEAIGKTLRSMKWTWQVEHSRAEEETGRAGSSVLAAPLQSESGADEEEGARPGNPQTGVEACGEQIHQGAESDPALRRSQGLPAEAPGVVHCNVVHRKKEEKVNGKAWKSGVDQPIDHDSFACSLARWCG